MAPRSPHRSSWASASGLDGGDGDTDNGSETGSIEVGGAEGIGSDGYCLRLAGVEAAEVEDSGGGSFDGVSDSTYYFESGGGWHG
jgi:hypothetical protein